MRLKNFLLLTILLLIPILSFADDTKKNDLTAINSFKSDSMDIHTLIEKAKGASSEDRIQIEELIKRKIAKAHRNSNP
jgi:hypothetical protein